jgi:spore coat polysaccharide biosynthesis predicted glycosyltransferase SpsG
MPTVPLLEIRADGGRRFGFGHVGRCLALAEALSEEEAVFRLSDPVAATFVAERGGRLAASDGQAKVVLLDRVASTSLDQVRRLQTGGSKVALLDDRGEARLRADLVIDPPTGASWPPATGPRLAGFEYVPIRSEVRSTRRAVNPAGVLVAMGGSDPEGMTQPLCDALSAAGMPVTALLGPGYAHPPPGDAVAIARPEGFTRALAGCAILVASFGQTLLEAGYLGIPAIALVLDEAQVVNARAFCEHGTALFVDGSGGLAATEVITSVERLRGDDSLYRALAGRGPELVDGRGADRVANAIRMLA